MLKVDFSQLPSVDLPEASSTIDLTVPPPDIDEITRLLSAISLLKNKGEVTLAIVTSIAVVKLCGYSVC